MEFGNKLQKTPGKQTGKKGKYMKSMKTLTAVICALVLLGSLSLARAEDSCCDKAKAKGEACAHKCCVEAKKDGKVCEKCNPKKDK